MLALLPTLEEHNFIGVDQIAQEAFGSSDRQTMRRVRKRIPKIAYHTGLEPVEEERQRPLRNGGHSTYYKVGGLRFPD